jgi:hypothetical protein
MQPIGTMKHWSHQLHDGMLSMGHHISDHLHSRTFWIGVGVAFLIVGLVTLVVFAARSAPIQLPKDYPYGGIPYSPYRF